VFYGYPSLVAIPGGWLVHFTENANNANGTEDAAVFQTTLASVPSTAYADLTALVEVDDPTYAFAALSALDAEEGATSAFADLSARLANPDISLGDWASRAPGTGGWRSVIPGGSLWTER
jgi:hypothetical protein